jgi:hypothetical protein
MGRCVRSRHFQAAASNDDLAIADNQGSEWLLALRGACFCFLNSESHEVTVIGFQYFYLLG